MATKSEWIAGVTRDGQRLHIPTCNVFRERQGLPPLPYWDVSQPSRGLGDSVAKFTHATGIAQGVRIVANALGFDCGCTQRQESLNALVPFKTKEDNPP